MSENKYLAWDFRGNTYKFPVEDLPQESPEIFSVTIKELQLISKSNVSFDDALERIDGPVYGLMNFLESQGRLNEVDYFIVGDKKPYYAPNREFIGDGKFDGKDGDKTYVFPIKMYKDYDFFLAELPELKIKGYSRSSAQEAFDYLKQTIIIIFQSPAVYDKENIRETFLVTNVPIPEIVLDNVGEIPTSEVPQGEVGNL
jgi:hypothetical protein